MVEAAEVTAPATAVASARAWVTAAAASGLFWIAGALARANSAVRAGCSTSFANHGLSDQLARTIIAPVGWIVARYDIHRIRQRRLGFQLNHSCDPGSRIVGLRSVIDRVVSACASSTQAR